jgi:RNA polymerase subunit RPABC4/transcription elongation factor Spt4
MSLQTRTSPDDRSSIEDGLDEYFCPVCGVELSLSSFLTPEQDYYCPFCATRQTPAVV